MTTPAGAIALLWLVVGSPWGGVPQLVSATTELREADGAVGLARENPRSLLDLSDDELKKRVESEAIPTAGA